MRLLRIIILFWAVAVAATLNAQDRDDRSLLEGWLEDNLSGVGRDVRVIGFTGALSSQATVEEITIADADGVWFRLRGAVLDWSRSALLSGALQVNELSAQEIVIERLPRSAPAGPRAETSEFSVPELPVSVSIGRVSTPRIALGPTVLGQAVTMSLEGAASIAGGEGTAVLSLDRTDGRQGRFAFEGSYSNTTRLLAIDLGLSEGPEGVAAGLLRLPTRDAMDLSISGEDPIDAFTAAVAFSTADQVHLEGTASLSRDDDQTRAFAAVLNGNLSPLVDSAYRPFFGDEAFLELAGRSFADGRIEIHAFEAMTQAMTLGGDVALAATGWPERMYLSGRIASADGSPVLLPFAGEGTSADSVDIDLDYDAGKGRAWLGSATIDGLSGQGMEAATLRMSGSGTIDLGSGDAPSRATGQIGLEAGGLAFADARVGRAVGTDLSGRLAFARRSGQPLEISEIVLSGEDYELAGDIDVTADPDSLTIAGAGGLRLAARDISRFAGLAQRPISGAARLNLSGDVQLPSGAFAIAVDGTGVNISAGEPRIDPLFIGESRIGASILRNSEGLDLSNLTIVAPNASARANAKLSEGANRISADVTLPDGAVIVDGLSGPIALEARADQANGVWKTRLAVRAPGGATAEVDASIAASASGIERVSGVFTMTARTLAPYAGIAGRNIGGSASISGNGTLRPGTGEVEILAGLEGDGLSVGVPEIDRLLAGRSGVRIDAQRDEKGVVLVRNATVNTDLVTLEVEGQGDTNAATVSGRGRLENLAVLVPGFDGPASADFSGTLGQDGWDVLADMQGPSGVGARISGRLAADSKAADILIAGQGPLGLANPFMAPNQAGGIARYDLRLQGPFALSSLSGRVTSDDARLALPSIGLAFDPITANVAVEAGRAIVDLNARSSDTGRLGLTGPISLSPPFEAALTARLRNLALYDAKLYRTSVSGSAEITGPLAGGAMISGSLTLDNTEIRVPDSGYSAQASIPEIAHIGEPAGVRLTRQWAGLVSEAGASGRSGPSYGLDVEVDAPARIFLRGRGMDAEFGGSVGIGGTTSDVVPQGGFELIRGRMDILGKRLMLTSGSVSMQGSFDAYIDVQAETQAGDVQVRVSLEGPASDPVVRFSSSPDLPEDEILARLIFGQGLDQISPFQALRLASAVATLSGRGGEGLIGNLREGAGLADLDITSDESGGVAVSAGTYLSDNLYTDVTVGATTGAEVNLNLNITPSLTARGSVSESGETGIGIFFERDY